jgi:hypothetical protein
MHGYIDLAALGKVLLASLLAGVGLVTVFGVGLVGVARWEGRVVDGHADGLSVQGVEPKGSPAWLVVAAVCFAVVLAGIGVGVWSITVE